MSRVSDHRRAHGQFFTPTPVVACCYDLLAGELAPGARIVDPACGDGAFLRAALERGLAPPEHLHGCDIDPALVALLQTEGLARVALADGLDPDSQPAAAFDLVVGNPPFGVATSERGGRAMPSEVRFLLRALDLARPGGLVALVLPSGVLANERLRPLRAGLLERASPLAVIALPRQTFSRAGTSALCSLVLLRRAPAPPGHPIFFASAARLDDLPRLAAAYRSRTDEGQTTNDERQTTNEGNASQCSMLNAQCFWLPQSAALAERMDVAYWEPATRAMLDRLAAGRPLRPLGELLEQPGGLIAGDHVRGSRGERKGAGLPYEYYQTRQFLPAGYNYAELERCDERAYRRLGYTAVQRHDILVSCAGVGGAGRARVCLITHSPGPSCTGDVLIVRAREPDPVFLFLLLRSRAGRAQLLRLQNGVGTVNLSVEELLRVQVPLLPPDRQRAYADAYAPAAAAHDQAMAALRSGDQAGYEQARAASELLLEQLTAALEGELGIANYEL
jgi:predicted RNA methylase